MNTNDLYIEYARCIEMCKETPLEGEELQCFKTKLCDGNYAFPDNNSQLWLWLDTGCVIEVAVAILENKPLFVGDEVYEKSTGRKFTVYNMSPCILIIIDKNYTWQPPAPKRTFELNGVELPCPVPMDDYGLFIYVAVEGSGKKCTNRFAFNSEEDARRVFSVLADQLEAAENQD